MSKPLSASEAGIYETLANRILAGDAQVMFLIRSKLFDKAYPKNSPIKQRAQDQAIHNAKLYLRKNREEAVNIAKDVGFAKPVTPGGNFPNLSDGLGEWILKLSENSLSKKIENGANVIESPVKGVTIIILLLISALVFFL